MGQMIRIKVCMFYKEIKITQINKKNCQSFRKQQIYMGDIFILKIKLNRPKRNQMKI